MTMTQDGLDPTTPSTGSHNQGHEDKAGSATASRFQEVSQREEKVHTPNLWEQKMEDVRREMATIKEAIKGKAPTTIDELIQRMDYPFTLEVMARPLPDKFKLP